MRLRGRNNDGKDNWLLIKERDELARKDAGAVEKEDTSVATGRSMEEIAAGRKVWHSNRKKNGAGNGAAKLERKAAARQRQRPRAQKKRSRKKPRAKLPAFVSPQLATLVDAPPAGDDWLHEIKFDGYRAITSLAGGKVVIRTRKGLDWTTKFQALVPALSELPCDSALLDGEIAVADAEGHTDFGALQNALSNGGKGIGYYLFDLLELDGEDLRKRPLDERKAKLAATAQGRRRAARLFRPPERLGRGGLRPRLQDQARRHRLQAPRRALRLRPQPVLAEEQMRHGAGVRHHRLAAVGQAAPAVPLAAAWRARGRRAALCRARRQRLFGRAAGRSRGASSESSSARARRCRTCRAAIARGVHFLEPKLVAQIAFRGWTRDNLVRQGSFKGLRTDKPASEIVRERAHAEGQGGETREGGGGESADAKASKRKASGKPSVVKSRGADEAEFAGVRVTHPDRVLFAAQGVTKRDLIEYYLSISDLILPHVARPAASLVRCPAGQRRPVLLPEARLGGFSRRIRAFSIKEKSGTREYLTIEDERGLVAAVQVGVLELHVWGSHDRYARAAGPHGVRLRSRRRPAVRHGARCGDRICATG